MEGGCRLLVALGEGVVRQRQAAQAGLLLKGNVADALQVAVVQTEALQERVTLQRRKWNILNFQHFLGGLRKVAQYRLLYW